MPFSSGNGIRDAREGAGQPPGQVSIVLIALQRGHLISRRPTPQASSLLQRMQRIFMQRPLFL
nr:MAG TPA: hypothetical protein [Caudoviricetes sp.]